jgi:hypothetical protein
MDQENINHSPQGDGEALLGIPAVVPEKAAAVPAWSRERLLQLAEHGQRLSNSRPRTKMAGGFWVLRRHFNEVCELVWGNAHLLPRGRKHEAKVLCGITWADHPRGQKIAMGRCVKYLVDHGVLPLTLANPDKNGGSWRYFLWDDLTAPRLTH